MKRLTTTLVLTLTLALALALPFAGAVLAEPQENEAPAGVVPPVPDSVIEMMRERDLIRHGELPAPKPAEPARPPRAPDASGAHFDAVLDAFRTAYTAQGRPSIAVYLNRSLSAEVREWTVHGGTLKIKSNSQVQANHDESWTRTEQDGGEMELAIGGPTADGAGAERDARWMWEFEEGLVEPFLRTNCRIIDRATIMRLEAARSARTGVDYAGLSTKKVEMDALAGHIDVLVEVQILEAPGEAHGYRFKATAKEVQTGRIIANVLSSGGGSTRYEFVGTSSGYQRRAILPSIQEISEGLSVDVMEALARVWG